MGLRRDASLRQSSLEPRATVARRRRIALFGLFAILFQAVLFGWHSHPLPGLSHSAASVIAAGKGAPLPADAPDDCDICAALHHHSAAPLDFVALALPPITALRVQSFTLALLARAPTRSFQARAPPRA